MPKLVNEPEELTAANGTASTIESLAFFLGPAIGGILVAGFGVPVVVLLNAATFVWSAALVSRIRVPSEALPETAGAAGADPGTAPAGDLLEAADEESESFFTESMAGFKTIWTDRDMRMISGVYAAQTVVAGASIVFGVEMAVQMTDFGTPGIGYLDSAMGVGALIGGLVAIGRASAGRLATDFGVGVVFWALPAPAHGHLAGDVGGVPGHVHHRRGQPDRGRQRHHDHPALGVRRGHGPGVRGTRDPADRIHGPRLDRDAGPAEH